MVFAARLAKWWGPALEGLWHTSKLLAGGNAKSSRGGDGISEDKAAKRGMAQELREFIGRDGGEGGGKTSFHKK